MYFFHLSLQVPHEAHGILILENWEMHWLTDLPGIAVASYRQTQAKLTEEALLPSQHSVFCDLFP